MARRSNSILLRVTGDTADAKAALRDVRQDLRRMSREEARVRLDIQTDRVKRQIEGVRNELDALSRKESSPRVELQTARASERLRLLELRLDRLGLKRVQIDVDVKRGALERTAAGIGTVERGLVGVGRGFAGIFQQVPLIGGLLTGALSGAFSIASSLGEALGGLVTRGITTLAQSFSQLGVLAGPIGSVVGSVFSLGASLAGLAAVAGGIVIALNALVGAIVALGGALIALVASIGAAIAGLGALAVAFGAVLIPILIVGIGVFQRFAAIIKARQAREQELAQAVQEQKTAEQQRKDALDASRQAHQRLSEATVEGNRAMAQSVLDLRDAELGLESSRLGVKEARLNLLEAKKALADFRNQKGLGGASLDSLFKRATDVTLDPAQQRAAIGDIKTAAGGKADPLELQQRILAVQRAQLGVKESINQTAHAEQTLAQATRTRANFVREGISAYKPYRQALQQVANAETRLSRAQDRTTAAQRKYERAVHGLSETERGTLSRLDALLKGFTALAKAFSDPIFSALNDVFDSLKGNAGFLTAALTEVGRAFGDVIRAFGRFLLEPGTRTAFTTMAAGAARLVRTLGAQAFVSFLHIMTQVAVTALPAVEAAARGVSGWLGRIAGQPGRISRAVQGVIGHFRTWAGLAGAVSRLVIALFSVAAPAGRSLAASLTSVVNHWTAWIRANPQGVREFFRTSVVRAREILKSIKDVVEWLRVHLPSAAHFAARAFTFVSTAIKTIGIIISPVVKAVQALSSALGYIVFRLIPKLKSIHLPKLPLTGGIHIPLPFIGRQSGGIVPGVGRGDIMPAMLEPGEFVVRRAVAQQIGLPALQALNGGGTVTQPSLMPGGAVHHHTWNLPAPLGQERFPDPQNMLALIQQAWEQGGGGLS